MLASGGLMTYRGMKLSGFALSLAAIIGFGAIEAQATEGYFAHGYGARHKALGGAGAADPGDSTIQAINPAGITMVDDQFSMSLSVFSPRRSFTATDGPPVNLGIFGTFPLNLLPPGTFDSEWNYFYVPNMAWTKRVDQPLFDTIGITLYGNGGMNTTWPEMQGSQFCQFLHTGFGVPGVGAFCFGAMGVNLEQAILSFSAAKKIGNVSIGVAPLLARQAIEIDGLQLFRGRSTQPNRVSNQGVDTSWGYGIRAGILVDLSPSIRIGASATSRMYMSRFKKYRGLFAQQGDFDIPAHVQVGVAMDVMPNVTVMADYKHIWYSTIKSVANPSTNIFNCTVTPSGAFGPGCLGADEGAGFGWDDVDIFKIGIEAELSPSVTVRAGYAYNTNPIDPRDVMFNIIAPAVVQHHFTAGAKIKVTDNLDLELAAMYVPSNSVTGTELGLSGFGPSNNSVEIEMHQYEVTAGIVYHFGGAPEPLK